MHTQMHMHTQIHTCTQAPRVKRQWKNGEACRSTYIHTYMHTGAEGEAAVEEWRRLQKYMEPLARASVALPPAAIRFDIGILATLFRCACVFVLACYMYVWVCLFDLTSEFLPHCLGVHVYLCWHVYVCIYVCMGVFIRFHIGILATLFECVCVFLLAQ
jgi:hypothetical protein